MLRAYVMFLALLIGAPAAGQSSDDDLATHPYVQTIDRYREAKKNGDDTAVAEILAEDSRIWFDKKEGAGSPRRAGGKGPWSDWDELFRSEGLVLDYFLEARAVRTLAWEINDWYRLVDRAASVYYISYYFDDDGRIEGTLIHSVRNPPPRDDRVDEFKAWANENHPGLLEELLPNDQIDPALEKAQKWKRYLLEWREDSGLGNPLSP